MLSLIPITCKKSSENCYMSWFWKVKKLQKMAVYTLKYIQSAFGIKLYLKLISASTENRMPMTNAENENRWRQNPFRYSLNQPIFLLSLDFSANLGQESHPSSTAACECISYIYQHMVLNVMQWMYHIISDQQYILHVFI